MRKWLLKSRFRGDCFMLKFLFFSSVFALSPAYGALLPAQVVLEKTVEHSGASSTIIEQMVSFHDGDQVYQVREIWTISSPKLMKLQFQSVSGGWSGQVLYNNGQRMQALDGKRSSRPAGPDVYEGLFSTRSADQLVEMLGKWGISFPLKNPPVAKEGNKLVITSPSGMRLSRSQGVVTYAFGEKSKAEATSLNPQLWIEQDQWVIRKLRLASRAQVRADDYQEWSKGFFYPQVKRLNWNKFEAVTSVTKASSRNNLPAGYFAANRLETSTHIDLPDASPLRLQVEEFYSRFR
jgi:hypothetical protein